MATNLTKRSAMHSSMEKKSQVGYQNPHFHPGDYTHAACVFSRLAVRGSKALAKRRWDRWSTSRLSNVGVYFNYRETSHRPPWKGNRPGLPIGWLDWAFPCLQLQPHVRWFPMFPPRVVRIRFGHFSFGRRFSDQVQWVESFERSRSGASKWGGGDLDLPNCRISAFFISRTSQGRQTYFAWRIQVLVATHLWPRAPVPSRSASVRAPGRLSRTCPSTSATSGTPGFWLLDFGVLHLGNMMESYYTA